MKRHLIFGMAGLFLPGGCRSPQPRLLSDCFERSETVGMQSLRRRIPREYDNSLTAVILKIHQR
ncbi:hypothetical protein [Rikenella microfusus]|uniref:Uncharacterized protein n=1 Tax=Rikenella microfusus TaxID=28139 RepID=A0A379MSX2_9BACT|nr:hypothetical protein [Rikenella microfusus]SUE33712.1 Uncharacterised protein [Rikenella microfusus]